MKKIMNYVRANCVRMVGGIAFIALGFLTGYVGLGFIFVAIGCIVITA